MENTLFNSNTLLSMDVEWSIFFLFVFQLYRNRSSQNPRQSSPQWSESSQGSRESMAASSLGRFYHIMFCIGK